MNRIDFSKLREGLSSCPSDFALDGLQGAALSSEEEGRLQKHVAGCESCTTRMAARRAGFEAFPDVDERKMLAAIRTRLAEPEAAPRLFARLAAFFRAPQTLAFAGALSILAVVLIVRHDSKPPQQAEDSVLPVDQVREKGGFGLHVYRQRGEGAEEMLSGERFRPGDRLRFGVDLPTEGHLSIVGIDERGELYTAWPLPASGPAQPVENSADLRPDTQRPAGKGQTLPGAVTLDESPGDEALYLVTCPISKGAPTCRSQGPGREPACQDGCAQLRFVIKKTP